MKSKKLILTMLCVFLSVALCGCSFSILPSGGKEQESWQSTNSGLSFSLGNFQLTNYASADSYSAYVGDNLSLRFDLYGKAGLLSDKTDKTYNATLTVSNAKVSNIYYSNKIENSYYADFEQMELNSGKYEFSFSRANIIKNAVCILCEMIPTSAGSNVVEVKVDGVTLKNNSISSKIMSGSNAYTIASFNKKFTATKDDITNCENTVNEIKRQIELNASEAEINTLKDKYTSQYNFLGDQLNIARLIYHKDTTVSANMDAYSDLNTDLNKLQVEYNKIFEDNISLKDAEEIAKLINENNELSLDYDKIENTSSANEVCTIYSKMVENNKKIATLNKYSNYMEYAYKEVYARNYTPQDAATISSYIKKYLTPLAASCQSQLDVLQYTMSKEDIRSAKRITENNFQTLGDDYIFDYFNTYSSDIASGMKSYFTSGEAYFATDENCYQGAYVAPMSEQGKACVYFGSNYQTIYTLIHEGGHYYYNYVNGADASYDLYETHSQGNEAMFTAYLKTVLKKNVYEWVKLSALQDWVNTVLLASAVNDFEQAVYLGSYTAAQYDDLFAEICKNYGVSATYYWRYSAVSSHGYYISYAVSQLVATDVFMKAEEDYNTAQSSFYQLFLGDCDNYFTKVKASGFMNPMLEADYSIFLIK